MADEVKTYTSQLAIQGRRKAESFLLSLKKLRQAESDPESAFDIDSLERLRQEVEDRKREVDRDVLAQEMLPQAAEILPQITARREYLIKETRVGVLMQIMEAIVSYDEERLEALQVFADHLGVSFRKRIILAIREGDTAEIAYLLARLFEQVLDQFCRMNLAEVPSYRVNLDYDEQQVS